MALYFTPPTAALVDPAPYSSHPSFGLFRHYRPFDAGINVWRLRDGSITTVEPAVESDASRVFHGGHIHEVNVAEAAALVAAGFAVVEATPAPVNPGLPGFDDIESDPNQPVNPGLTTSGVGVMALGTASLGGQ